MQMSHRIPNLHYSDRTASDIRPSYHRDALFINKEHRKIFGATKEIPGGSWRVTHINYTSSDIIQEM